MLFLHTTFCKCLINSVNLRCEEFGVIYQEFEIVNLANYLGR